MAATPSNAINHTQIGPVMFNGTSLFTQGAYPLCHNIGFSYSAGTFTVQGSDGTALGTSNPGYIIVNNGTTPGQLKTLLVTANQTFTDGAGGTTATQRFGLVSGDVWGANDLPFFLYAVQKSDQTAIAFMISRNPAAKLAPLAASIGQSGAVVNVGQGDFFSLAAITTSQYASQPCIYLGCFRMRFVGASNSWTVQAIDSTKDGIGLNFNSTPFSMPTGVQGDASGSFFYTSGGTAPIWSSQQLNYTVRQDGTILINFSANTNTTPGAGAAGTSIGMPFTIPTVQQPLIGILWQNTSANVNQALQPITQSGTPAFLVNIFSNGGTGFVGNGAFLAGSTLSMNASTKIF